MQKAIFSVNTYNFESLALDIFKYQSEHCIIYRQYLQLLQTDLTKILKLEDIPYLPVEFFKNFSVTTGSFVPELIFESSTTGGMAASKHCVRSSEWYTESFTKCFESFFNKSGDYCHLALLPSYMERGNSSLVYQVDQFIRNSKFSHSGFYLYNFEELRDRLLQNETERIPTILWGVTFALLEFTEKYSMNLKHTTVIETGGMKGKRKEIVREELHKKLKYSLGLDAIAGEYGMTELMSQAYSVRDGVFKCPAWMHVSGREVNDPLSHSSSTGKNVVLNIIDLANIHSCCFIATSDIGKIHENGEFEVLGRLDHSDTRGCNLMAG